MVFDFEYKKDEVELEFTYRFKKKIPRDSYPADMKPEDMARLELEAAKLNAAETVEWGLEGDDNAFVEVRLEYRGTISVTGGQEISSSSGSGG